MADGGVPFSSADRALLERNFFIGDPQVLDSLVAEIPTDVRTPGIVYRYSLPHDRPKVRCAVCGRHVHWKGYVIDVGEGRHALLGRNCGKDRFGFDWEREEAHFLKQQDRQLDLRRYILARPLAEQLEVELEIVMNSEAVAVFERYFEFLKKDFPKLAVALSGSARNGGRLEGVDEVEDKNETLRLARVQRPDLFSAVDLAESEIKAASARQRLNKYLQGQGRVFVPKEVLVGHFAGGSLFTRGGWPSLHLALARGLRAVRDGLEHGPPGGDGAGLDVLKSLEGFRSCVDEAMAALDLAAEFDAFTSPTNIALLAEWSHKAPSLPWTFTAVDRSLRWGDTRRLEVSYDWEPPSLKNLAEFRSALKATEGPAPASEPDEQAPE